jgi:hypothetical protein
MGYKQLKRAGEAASREADRLRNAGRHTEATAADRRAEQSWQQARAADPQQYQQDLDNYLNS